MPRNSPFNGKTTGIGCRFEYLGPRIEFAGELAGINSSVTGTSIHD
jgi:hypothetical protein